MVKIDRIDAKILESLIGNARVKLKDLAELFRISSTAVINRIERLNKKNIIVKPALNVNMAYFGYPYPVLIGVNLDRKHEKSVIELISKHTKVAGIDQSIGKYDLCLFVFAKDVNDLDKLKHIIRKHEGIRNIEINIWNKIHYNFDSVKL